MDKSAKMPVSDGLIREMLTEDRNREVMRENERLRETRDEMPPDVYDDPGWRRSRSEEERNMARMRHDFAFWCKKCVQIRDKRTGKFVEFTLNRPQRKAVAVMEEQRRRGEPIRIVMLKARQWGGSTLIQMYMAWIQIIHRENWHSFICAHVKDTSATIRGMYSRMLANYPKDYWPCETPPQFSSYERSLNTRVISGRDCRVTLGSCESQEAARGNDIAMAHLSEVAFWRDTNQRSPEDFIRSVCSGIPLEPLTVIALESTANGVGNYFHNEWLRAKEGVSAYKPVFVPWYEIEMYRIELKDDEAKERVIRQMDDYEMHLWDVGCSLSQIAWYHAKRMEMSSHRAMMAEYPTDDIEAFVNTGNDVFGSEAVERLRQGCCNPLITGDIATPIAKAPRHADMSIYTDPRGALKIWEQPQPDNQDVSYVAVVDVGGRSDSSDYSVIAILKTDRNTHTPEVVAQWRGHIDHDLLAEKALQLARYYCEALLVVESNTYEQDVSSGGQALYLLERINMEYPNIYRRRVRDAVRQNMESRIGFHTNASTKQLVITTLIAEVRDGTYIERDNEACNELLTYERRANGSYGARKGYHDDILMTRAIGLYVIRADPWVFEADRALAGLSGRVY